MVAPLPGKILIVDDDQDVLDSLKDLLAFEGGYTVETAKDVVSAKKNLDHFKADIALVDITIG